LVGDVAPHRTWVLVAMCCLVAARLGSEAVSREWWLGAVSARLDAAVAPPLWWMLAAVCVASVLVPRTATHAVSRAPRHARVLLVLFVVVACHSGAQWHRLATPQTGEYSGIAYARSDAHTRNGALSMIVEVEGENFRLVVRGPARGDLVRVMMGDALLIDADRRAYDARRLRFSAGRHVQGDLREVTVHATAPSRALWHRAANRIHRVVDRGSRTMSHDDASLVRGLVLGDESRQPPRMTEAFRAAGLGHLLAVSGQNVAILLAALTPALRRLSRWPRLAAALGIVASFALVTRLESSVVRAGVMAAIVQVAYAIGRDVAPLRALCLTVTAMVVMDPLAVWSVGFVLSVAATAGLVVITPLLGSGIVAATASAQIAVAPFVVLWFRSMPVVALATNVLAVPVGSAVMMVAPPLLLAAAFLPDTLAAWCVAPVAAAVRLLWWVAEWGLRLSLPARVNLVAWALVAVVIAVAIVRGAHHPRARL
jgi:competence protein ComEC